MTKNIIEVKDLHFSYTVEPLLAGVNFSLKEGNTVALAGGNGSGKSTFLKLLIGELEKDKGSIRLFGKDIENINNFSRLSYVPQVQSVDNISFPLTCEEMLTLANYRQMGRLIKIPRKKDKALAAKILAEYKLLPYLKVPFNELSGGLRQRVMICRAMMTKPELLILDEPTSGVDFESKVDFLERLEELSHSNNLSILIVTHELDFVGQHVKLDKTYKFEEGEIRDV